MTERTQDDRGQVHWRPKGRQRSAARRAFLVICIIVSLESVVAWRPWKSPFRENFRFVCPPNSIIYSIASYQDEEQEDRRYMFDCEHTDVVFYKCEWGDYRGDYWGRQEYRCGDNGMLTGSESLYHTSFKDRLFRHKCCYTQEYSLTSCGFSSMLPYRMCNDENHFRFESQPGYVQVLFYSYYQNSERDRSYRFKTCRLVRSNNG